MSARKSLNKRGQKGAARVRPVRSKSLSFDGELRTVEPRGGRSRACLLRAPSLKLWSVGDRSGCEGQVSRAASNGVRTWIELDAEACRHNVKTFRKLIGPNVKLFSVVKSNAYGHGLPVFPKLIESMGIDPVRNKPLHAAAAAPSAERISNGVDGFCVDSILEGLRLRKEGIKKPILVLGFTLPAFFGKAALNNIAVTISSFDSLRAFERTKRKPFFHLKIDTGMHRQGFYQEDLPKVVRLLTKSLNPKLAGIYTHFASKDIKDRAYSEQQFRNFEKAVTILERAGFKNLIRHAAATGGAFISPKYHLDAVRIGIGSYGLWPSGELEAALFKKISLKPILSWRTMISEVKSLSAGDCVGYDMTECVNRPTKAAVLPIGYWHGFPRSLSGIGEVLIRGRRARVLGKVSMDMTVIDVTGIDCRPGDVTTIIGKDSGNELTASEVAQRAGTINYEFVTRLNPLIQKIVV